VHVLCLLYVQRLLQIFDDKEYEVDELSFIKKALQDEVASQIND